MELSELYEAYKPFWDLHDPKYREVFYMALDMEYTARGHKNKIVSCQIATVSMFGAKNIMRILKPGESLTLIQIVEAGIKSVVSDKDRADLRGPILVNLISHFSLAEWAGMADRAEPYITKKIMVIRKSPVTGVHPINLVINKQWVVDLHLFDTKLLAPASHQSLKDLSNLLGPDDIGKSDVPDGYIQRMDQYLWDYPDDFRTYALRDTEVTLKLFFLLQECLNNLSTGKIEKLYKTLASAAVAGFLEGKKKEHKNYLSSLKQPKFSQAFELVKRSYHGGRSEAYFVGNTADYEDSVGQTFLDVDLKGCYPTTMLFCPKIDVEGEVDYIPRVIKIDDAVESKLLQENVPLQIIKRVRRVLKTGSAEFEKVLSGIPQTSIARIIREKATVVNNRLINKWFAESKGRRNDEEIILTPGFALVNFSFINDQGEATTQYPCLPDWHHRFGLLYPLEGQTVVAAPEIVLALEAGARIEALSSLELPIQQDADGRPVKIAFDHISTLAKERDRYAHDITNPKANVLERLVKEFMNSFYGKFSQAINPRNMYSPATGEYFPMGSSLLTEPCTASLVTSQARAVLSALLIAVERFNNSGAIDQNLTVISATTDGLLIGVPSNGINVEREYYEKANKLETLKLKDDVKNQLAKVLEQHGCSGLIDEMEKFPQVQQMHRARACMTGDPNILVIKHAADIIVSVKTRFQIGYLDSGRVTILAKGGHRAPQLDTQQDTVTKEGNWLNQHVLQAKQGRDLIDRYEQATLPSLKTILESGGTRDLTTQVRSHKINTDFDYKRKIVRDPENDNKISPVTVPHRNRSEMLTYRNEMESIRRNRSKKEQRSSYNQKSAGYIAHPEKVLDRVKMKGRSTRLRGGEPVAVARTFARGIMQGQIPTNATCWTNEEKAEKFNKIWEQEGLLESYPRNWSRNDFKNAQRGLFEPGSISPDIRTENLVVRLAESFGIDPEQAKKIIFATDEFLATNVNLIEDVIAAIIKGPHLNLEPLKTLYNAGKLPSLQKMKDIFNPQLSADQVAACIDRPFRPGRQNSCEVKKITRLFTRLSIGKDAAQQCAKILITRSQTVKYDRRNPGQKKCTDHFLQAIVQTALGGKKLNSREILDNLSKFGLTKKRYYSLKNERFTPNCIKNSALNRKQIRMMAEGFKRDPQPFLEVLLDK